MALVDFYPSMQPSAVEVQNGKFFTLPIRLTKITQILSVLTHFISHDAGLTLPTDDNTMLSVVIEVVEYHCVFPLH